VHNLRYILKYIYIYKLRLDLDANMPMRMDASDIPVLPHATVDLDRRIKVGRLKLDDLHSRMRIKTDVLHPAAAPFCKELAFACYVYDQDDIHLYTNAMTLKSDALGKHFDLASHLINNIEAFRKQVSYSRPAPNVLIGRVSRVYDKYCDRVDCEGVKLFTDLNKKQWKEYLVHVRKFVVPPNH
jgi:hypothetical protein